MQNKLKWWFCFVSVLSAPFLLTILTHQLGLALPGKFKTSAWEVGVSIAFIGTGIPVAMLIGRSTFGLLSRTVLSFIVLCILLMSAFVIQIHSTCGPTGEYIGQVDAPWRDSECD